MYLFLIEMAFLLEHQMNYKKVLILGGTENAARLAFQISRKLPKIKLITSLAGRTSKPKKIYGSVRNGGFGGPEGLANFITGNNITLLIDATHPFSTRISENAIFACSKANVPRAILSRPEWKLPPKANCTEVRTLANAATAIDQKAQRVFLTTGTKDLDLFEPLNNKWFLIRLIEKPQKKINIKNYKLLLSRPPYGFKSERKLLLDNKIDCLISKNSGSDATKSKIIAALHLDIQVILVSQPSPPPGLIFFSVGECIDWLRFN